MKKKQKTIQQNFISNHFDDFEEYKKYKSEFEDSIIPEVCMEAEKSIADDYSIYDIRKTECERYYALIRKYKPENIILTGVYNGVLALGILTAINRNEHGMLHSINQTDKNIEEYSEFFIRNGPSAADAKSTVLPDDRQAGWVIPDYLKQNWNHVTGNTTDFLPILVNDIENIDIFFHNSKHSQSQMLFEFQIIWEHLIPGGIMLSHHAGQNAAYNTFLDEKDVNSGLVHIRLLENSVEKSIYIKKAN